jgi:hypothetical protein
MIKLKRDPSLGQADSNAAQMWGLEAGVGWAWAVCLLVCRKRHPAQASVTDLRGDLVCVVPYFPR